MFGTLLQAYHIISILCMNTMCKKFHMFDIFTGYRIGRLLSVIHFYRKKMVEYFSNASLKHGLPRESKQVFYDLSLCEYLKGKVS